LASKPSRDKVNYVFRCRIRRQKEADPRDLFLAEIEAATPWTALVIALSHILKAMDAAGHQSVWSEYCAFISCSHVRPMEALI